MLAIDAAIRQDQNVASSLAMIWVSFLIKLFQGAFHAAAILGRIEQDRQSDRPKIKPV